MQTVGASHSKQFLHHSFVMSALQDRHALAISDSAVYFPSASVVRDDGHETERCKQAGLAIALLTLLVFTCEYVLLGRNKLKHGPVLLWVLRLLVGSNRSSDHMIRALWLQTIDSRLGFGLPNNKQNYWENNLANKWIHHLNAFSPVLETLTRANPLKCWPSQR
jgi:hypothetical protein